MSWGAFPEDVVGRLRALEWDNPANLRKRLLGERCFPVEMNLRPPSGVLALDDLGRFKAWVAAWRGWPTQAQVRYEWRSFRQIGRHRVPVKLVLCSIRELIECLGEACVERSRGWERKMGPLLEVDRALYASLVRNLDALEKLSMEEACGLARVVPQLRAGIGQGAYLRALPLRGVDTKFLERHQGLVTELLDVIHGGAVSAGGGLSSWLHCRSNPTGWLQLRALCDDARSRMAGFAMLRLPTGDLLAQPLPAARILIVENVQSGLALPVLPDTIAVFGTGQNLAWTKAAWLAEKRVAYWGDIDTWGLKFLGDARRRVGRLDAIMMDADTLERFLDRAVLESKPWTGDLPGLQADEVALRDRLLTGDGRAHRLEQERLDGAYIAEHLCDWVAR